MNEMKIFDDAVRTLSSRMFHGGQALKEIPGSLKEILGQNRWNKPMWPERVDMNTGEVYRFDRFEDFVTTQPLAGLGADMAKLKAVCKDDLEALDLIDRAVQRKPGNPTGANQYTGGNVRNPNVSPRPAPDTREDILRRLRAHAPELHARVLAREMTIAEAAREAGFRRPPEPFRIACRAWEKMIPEERDAFEDFIGNWRRRHAV
jgi:hypothetical protein